MRRSLGSPSLKKDRKLAAVQQLQLHFGPVLNSGLFSTHWLNNRLRLEPEWATPRDEANAVLAELANLWKVQRGRVAQYQGEQAFEYAFIQPVLESLGWKPNYPSCQSHSSRATRAEVGVDHNGVDDDCAAVGRGCAPVERNLARRRMKPGRCQSASFTPTVASSLKRSTGSFADHAMPRRSRMRNSGSSNVHE